MKLIISPFYRSVDLCFSLFTDKIRDGLIQNYIHIYKTDKKRISLVRQWSLSSVRLAKSQRTSRG